MKKHRRFLFNFLVYSVTYWLGTFLLGDVRWARSFIFYFVGLVFYFPLAFLWEWFFSTWRKKRSVSQSEGE